MITGTLSGVGTLTGTLGGLATIDGGLTVPQRIVDFYEGAYTFTPSAEEQVIEIKDKTAHENITINPIPSSYVQPTTTVGATTYRASTSDQTIQSGTYHSAAATIAAVSQTNLEAGNIKSGTTISISNGQNNLWSVTGTYTGGGGSSSPTLLGTLAVGTISTSSTTDTDTGKSITVKGIYAYDLLICQCSVDTKTNGRHVVSTRLCWLTASSAIGTKNGATFATATWNVKLSSSGNATSRSNTTAYGVYAKAATISAGNTGDNGQAVITIYQRYNSTQTGTINGSYTMRVYGVKLYDLV